MIVVADSSPVVLLLKIGHIEVLPELFGHVLVPPEVSSELAHANRPPIVRAFIAAPPSWLTERAPDSRQSISGLHAGELAAISLAIELHADLLLIDETRGRKAAADRGIPVAGTVGVLEFAADLGLLDLASAFELVKQTDFWISPDLLDARLRLFQARKG